MQCRTPLVVGVYAPRIFCTKNRTLAGRTASGNAATGDCNVRLPATLSPYDEIVRGDGVGERREWLHGGMVVGGVAVPPGNDRVALVCCGQEISISFYCFLLYDDSGRAH